METQEYKNVGRNDPCPCNSGKKFKKCHGENTPWQGNAKTEVAAPVEGADANADAGNGMPSFDPSKMDLNWLATFSGAIQRLPKGQLQHLQGLMQKAMAGKDVARELEEFQRKLPPSFQELLKGSPELDQQMADAQSSAQSDQPLAPLSDEQRSKLQEIQKNNEKAGLSRLWNKFRNK
jgi:hypothetical protein